MKRTAWECSSAESIGSHWHSFGYHYRPWALLVQFLTVATAELCFTPQSYGLRVFSLQWFPCWLRLELRASWAQLLASWRWALTLLVIAAVVPVLPLIAMPGCSWGSSLSFGLTWENFSTCCWVKKMATYFKCWGLLHFTGASPVPVTVMGCRDAEELWGRLSPGIALKCRLQVFPATWQRLR